MIKKLLKKIFGGTAKEVQPAAAEKKGRAGREPQAPAAQERSGAKAGGRSGGERPSGEAAATGGGQRRRRRGGRGRGRSAAGAAASGGREEGRPREETVRTREESAGAAGAERAAGTPAEGEGAARPRRRRRRRRGSSKPGGDAASGAQDPGIGAGPAGDAGATDAAAATGVTDAADATAALKAIEALEALEALDGGAEDLVPAPEFEEGEPAVEEDARRPDRPRRERRPHADEALPLPVLPPIPPWTAPADPTLFANYDLPPEVQRGIADAGFAACTPVQAKVLPLSLEGRDVAAQSQTGTGKTAAFLITIFARLLRRGPVDGPKPRALVIAPTRELAVQIESDAALLGAHTGLTTAAVFGGVDYDKQRRALEQGADVVIGTPGRLIDYLKQGVWRPEGVELLVIDEADRMLDMGFIRDLRFILRRLPPYARRQSMLFSATLSWNVTELTYEYMNIPAEVRATPERMTADLAVEELYHVARDEKPALLLGIISREAPERTMIFTNTKVEAEKVAKLLEHHGVRARGITGNLEQARRLKLMEEFKSGTLPIMVATDVASRGLHIDAVSHVVNWDLPQDPEDYVHRIGRTARAGAAGKAISLADESGALNLEAIEKLIGYKIPVVWHENEHLAEVKPGWREAAARERRERDRELEARGIRPRSGGGGRTGGGRTGGRPGGGRRPGGSGRR